jgi:phosphatidylinositol alpha-1,6-mannosyltransferase
MRAIDSKQDDLATSGDAAHPGLRRGAARREAAEGDRVLLFSFNYPPNDGGVSRLCAELVSGLQRRGVGIQVLSQRRDGVGSYLPSVPEERVAMRRPWRELAALRELRRTGANAAVICGRWYPEGLLAALAGVRPIVILAHGLEIKPTREHWRRRIWLWLMQRVLDRAEVVVANSGYTAQLVRTMAPSARIAAVPLGVDHRRFCPGDRRSARRSLAIPEDKHVILTVARILAHKGHGLVLEALASMPASVRESFVYLVAGQGRDLEMLQKEADALGLEGVVRWLGYVQEADLPDLYRSADVFVLCSREDRDRPEVEGFGLAFLEAQACGTPVVGTRTGGISDAVQDGRGGWLIEQDDAAALAAMLAHLVEAPGDFARMGRIARQRVEQECTWNHYVDGFIEALDRRAVALR